MPCLLGLRTFLTAPVREAAPLQVNSLLGAYASTLFLTLTNPTTILSFAAVFSTLGLVGTRAGYLAASVLVLGVFLGSAVWWLGLSGGVGAYRDRIGPGALRWVNRGSGALIAAFGVGALISGAIQLS